jgi:hypothetical protein
MLVVTAVADVADGDPPVVLGVVVLGVLDHFVNQFQPQITDKACKLQVYKYGFSTAF